MDFHLGNMQELKEDLSLTKNVKFSKRKIAIKKVIGNMTVGIDMSDLYKEVIECTKYPDLETNRLIHLYIINYARTSPQITKYSLPELEKGTSDLNSVIRALSIRTMSYINVDIVMNSLADQLHTLLKDRDPYVKKTSALALYKLFSNDNTLFNHDPDLLDLLKEHLYDENPNIVSNAVTLLTEISKTLATPVINFDSTMTQRLASTLNGCSEWNQINLLSALMSCVPQTNDDAVDLIERIKPRFLHNNSGVILASIRLVSYLMNYVNDKEYLQILCEKMTNPLVILLNFGPQVQLVTLKSLQLLHERWPVIMQGQLQSLFCKHSDLNYVKIEKLKLLVQLADDDSASLVLMELEEYALDNNQEFVAKVLEAVADISIKLSKASDKGVSICMKLLKKKSAKASDSVFITMQRIFVRYPNRYKKYLNYMFLFASHISDPDAKSALVWLAGTYLNTIKNSEAILNSYAKDFSQQPTNVQLSILISLAKLFISKPSVLGGIITDVLTAATKESTDPDVRDRAFFYWRLFSLSPSNAKAVVLSKASNVSKYFDPMDVDKLDSLLLQLSKVSAVIYDKPYKLVEESNKGALPFSPALVKIRLPFPIAPYTNVNEEVIDTVVYLDRSGNNSNSSSSSNIKSKLNEISYGFVEDIDDEDNDNSKARASGSTQFHSTEPVPPSFDNTSPESLNHDPYLALADFPLDGDGDDLFPGMSSPWAQTSSSAAKASPQMASLHRAFTKSFRVDSLKSNPASAEQLAESTFASTIHKYTLAAQQTPNTSTYSAYPKPHALFSDLDPLNQPDARTLNRQSTMPALSIYGASTSSANNSAYTAQRSQSSGYFLDLAVPANNGLQTNQYGTIKTKNTGIANELSENPLISTPNSFSNLMSNSSLTSNSSSYSDLRITTLPNQQPATIKSKFLANGGPATALVGLGVVPGGEEAAVLRAAGSRNIDSLSSLGVSSNSNNKNHLLTAKATGMNMYTSYSSGLNQPNQLNSNSTKQKLLDSQQTNGLEIYGAFERLNDEVSLALTCSNLSSMPITDFALQLNLNTFGLAPGMPMKLPNDCLNPGDISSVKIPLIIGESAMIQQMTPINNLQMALKSSHGVFYFQTMFSLHILLLDDKQGKLEQNEFLRLWQELAEPHQHRISFENTQFNLTDIRNKLYMNNIFTVAQRQTEQFHVFFTSSKLFDQTVFVSEIKLTLDLKFAQVVSKSLTTIYLPSHCDAIKGILTA